MLRQYAIKEYGGLEADLPSTLPYGDTYLTSDTDKFYKYGQDNLPKEISGGAGGGDFLPLTGGSVTGYTEVEFQTEATSGLISGFKSNITSEGSGAFVTGSYSRTQHNGTNAGGYNYGAYNKADMQGTNGYSGVLYGSYSEALMSGSDPNATNASWSSLYGMQSKAKVTGSGDLGYVIGNNVSAETTSGSGADIEFLQGQHTTVKHLDGNVNGSVMVSILDYDGNSAATIGGDFAYLRIQNDTVPNVTGTKKAIDCQSNFESTFNGPITAQEYNLNSIQSAPASSTSTGTPGEIRYTASAIYVCTAVDTWKRTALETF